MMSNGGTVGSVITANRALKVRVSMELDWLNWHHSGMVMLKPETETPNKLMIRELE